MSDRFLMAFELTDGPVIRAHASDATIEQWLNDAGGRTFESGLYRIHTKSSARAADALVREAFPEFASRLSCFGYDWLGRQFATDSMRGSDDHEVLMFEPGTGKVLEIPVPFSKFHDDELVDYADAALARTFFDTWRAAGGQAPSLSECVGYRRPLFLGGADSTANLEVSNLDVYWTTMGQLRRQVMDLPVGTSVSDIQTGL